MIGKVKSLQICNVFIPKVTQKHLLKIVVKVALLVLGAPVSLVFLATRFKRRIVDWLIKDAMRDSCRAVWKEFYEKNKDKLKNSIDTNGFNIFFDKYPCKLHDMSIFLLNHSNNDKKIHLYKKHSNLFLGLNSLFLAHKIFIEKNN